MVAGAGLDAPVRLIVRRVQPTPGSQLALFATYSYHAAVARALDRDAHTIGQWTTAFAEGGPRALSFEQSGGSPPR